MTRNPRFATLRRVEEAIAASARGGSPRVQAWAALVQQSLQPVETQAELDAIATAVIAGQTAAGTDAERMLYVLLAALVIRRNL